MCHSWHGDADCDTVRCAREVRPGVMRFELEVRCLPCADCHVWHSPNESCDNWRMDRRLTRVPAALIRNRAVDAASVEVQAPAHSDLASQRLDIGSMDRVCPFCSARFWPGESINCCFNGSLIIEEPVIPDDLLALMFSADVRKNMRSYNMAMAMASVGHSKDGFPDGVFVLSGKSYHRLGMSVVPPMGISHNFAQIYVLDTEDATSRRMAIFGNRLNRSVLSQMHELFLTHNPLASQYRAAAAMDVPELVWTSEDDIMRMHMGAIVSSYGCRSIVISKFDRDGRPGVNRLQFIDDGHALYHPLAYPLLFPVGNIGWYQRMKRQDSSGADQLHTVTLTDYGRYVLMHRSQPSHLQRCGKLALEYAPVNHTSAIAVTVWI